MAIEELTDEEVSIVSNGSNCFSGTSYAMGAGSVLVTGSNRRQLIFPYIKDRKVIELGPGEHPYLIGEPSEYVGVEPFCIDYAVGALEDPTRLALDMPRNHLMDLKSRGKISVVKGDGYSYLREQLANSAIVYSFGVIEKGIIGGKILGATLDKYFKALAYHIVRVTPRGGITMHCSSNLIVVEDFIEMGLKPLFLLSNGSDEPICQGGIFLKPN